MFLKNRARKFKQVDLFYFFGKQLFILLRFRFESAFYLYLEVLEPKL